MNPPWEEQAFDDLADAYVRASPDERVDIERAVVRVNRLLGEAPERQGESRGGVNRVMFEGRLVVHFRVVPGGVARVLRVRWAPWRS